MLATSVCLGSSGWGVALAATPVPHAVLAPAGAGPKLAILPLQVEGGLGSSDQAELMKALMARQSFTMIMSSAASGMSAV